MRVGEGVRSPSWWRRVVVAVSLAASIAGLLAHGVSAEEAPKFSVAPIAPGEASAPPGRSHFTFDAHPGATLTSQVRVSNTGGAAGSLRLYAVDAATGQVSGAVMLLRQDPKRRLGGWVNLATSEFTLEPGQSRDVSFTVTVPPDARPGEHLGGIVAEDVKLSHSSADARRPDAARPDSAGFQIMVQNRVAAAVEVMLPGPITEEITVSGVAPGGQRGYQTLLLGLRNAGNVRLKPTGWLQVTDAQGTLVQDIPLRLDTFVPETSIDFPVFLRPPGLGVGEYTVSLLLQYGHGKETRYTTKLNVSPLQLAQVFGAQKPLEAPAQARPATPLPTDQSALLLVALGVAVALAAMLLLRGLGALYRRARRKAAPASFATPVRPPSSRSSYDDWDTA